MLLTPIRHSKVDRDGPMAIASRVPVGSNPPVEESLLDRRIALLTLAAAVFLAGGCAQKKEATMSSSPSVTKAPFGAMATGEAVDLYTLKNASGMEAAIMNRGAILVSLKVAVTALPRAT